MSEDTIRLSVPIDRELNNQFSSMIPQGLKAQVIRSLVELTIKSQKEIGSEDYLIDHLVRGQVSLRIDK